ncbi:MAG: hypothetical protein ACXVIY_05635 [Mucilaginibacter sp.]
MKYLMISAMLYLTTSVVYCQEITLKAGIEATYQLSESADKKFSLTLIDSKAIDQGTIESDIRKEKVDSNQVKMVLFSVPMDDKKRSSFLIKTGISQVLKYSARIKRAGRRNFSVTDVMPVPGKLFSNEMWSYEISEIILSDFEEGSF